MEDTKISTFRPTMRKNKLFRRPGAGEQLKPVDKMPPSDFTYGIPNRNKGGGVRQAINEWLYFTPSVACDEISPNFKKLNAETIKVGNKTLQEHKLFRQQNRDLSTYYVRDYDKIPMSKIPDMIYGKTTNVDKRIKINDVLSCKFFKDKMARLELLENYRREEAIQAQKQKKRSLLRKMDSVRAEITHAKNQESETPLWKMSKFLKIGPRIKSWGRRKAPAGGDQGSDCDCSCSCSNACPCSCSSACSATCSGACSATCSGDCPCSCSSIRSCVIHINEK